MTLPSNLHSIFVVVFLVFVLLFALVHSLRRGAP
jgi:hypothetical protein